jgi:hypothetical protein
LTERKRERPGKIDLGSASGLCLANLVEYTFHFCAVPVSISWSSLQAVGFLLSYLALSAIEVFKSDTNDAKDETAQATSSKLR